MFTSFQKPKNLFIKISIVNFHNCAIEFPPAENCRGLPMPMGNGGAGRQFKPTHTTVRKQLQLFNRIYPPIRTPQTLATLCTFVEHKGN